MLTRFIQSNRIPREIKIKLLATTYSLIENYREVEDQLAGTKYECMLTA